jgi:hypothetical protein
MKEKKICREKHLEKTHEKKAHFSLVELNICTIIAREVSSRDNQRVKKKSRACRGEKGDILACV